MGRTYTVAEPTTNQLNNDFVILFRTLSFSRATDRPTWSSRAKTKTILHTELIPSSWFCERKKQKKDRIQTDIEKRFNVYYGVSIFIYRKK